MIKDDISYHANTSTGSGSGSVVELLNSLAPAANFEAGDKAYIASTSQNAITTNSFTNKRVIGFFVLQSINTSTTVQNPDRDNNLIYTHTGSSWGYTSGA